MGVAGRMKGTCGRNIIYRADNLELCDMELYFFDDLNKLGLGSLTAWYLP